MYRINIMRYDVHIKELTWCELPTWGKFATIQEADDYIKLHQPNIDRREFSLVYEEDNNN